MTIIDEVEDEDDEDDEDDEGINYDEKEEEVLGDNDKYIINDEGVCDCDHEEKFKLLLLKFCSKKDIKRFKRNAQYKKGKPAHPAIERPRHQHHQRLLTARVCFAPSRALRRTWGEGFSQSNPNNDNSNHINNNKKVKQLCKVPPLP